MKKITAALLFCLGAGLFAAPPEWNYSFSGNELKVTASVPEREYLYRKATSVALFEAGKKFEPVSVPSSVPHEDDFSGKTEIYRGGKPLTWVFRSEKWHFPLELKMEWQGCSEGTADRPGVCFLPGSGRMILKESQAHPVPCRIVFDQTKDPVPSPESSTFPPFEILQIGRAHV